MIIAPAVPMSWSDRWREANPGPAPPEHDRAFVKFQEAIFELSKTESSYFSHLDTLNKVRACVGDEFQLGCDSVQECRA